ncbi:MAG: hypothetical protein WCI77_09850 [Candidatus Omnitrophota bacterium]
MRKKASILMICLWILAILVIFAVGLAHRASLKVRIVRYQRNRLKAQLLAQAGIDKVIEAVMSDKTVNYDTLQDGWADNEAQFKASKCGSEKDGYATIYYTQTEDSRSKIIYGASDEERRININTLTQEQLEQLFVDKGVSADATALAFAVAQWIHGSSDASAAGKSFLKAEPLKTIQELLLALEYFYKQKGNSDYQKKAFETYGVICEILTVCTNGNLNINTVSKEVLGIFTRCLAQNNEEKNAAGKITDMLIALREEKKFFTQLSEVNLDLASDSTALTLFNTLKGHLTVKSSYFRINVEGYAGNTTKKITAICDRKGIISYWHEN